MMLTSSQRAYTHTHTQLSSSKVRLCYEGWLNITQPDLSERQTRLAEVSSVGLNARPTYRILPGFGGHNAGS